MSTTDTSGLTWIGVQRVQCALNARGAHLTVDGKWGPRTDEAMTAFVNRSFDYGYESPPDGAAVVRVTPALSAVLRCPASTPIVTTTPTASFPWGWLVLGAAVVAGGYVWWRYA